jgi:hypothetical protein
VTGEAVPCIYLYISWQLENLSGVGQ